MTYGSLFSGIGGLDLGLDRAGFQCRWQVENEPYAVRVLEKHWPHVKRYGDITTVHGDELEPVDLICGGFPCQDLSQAGKRIGIEGTRSGLWFEYARLVGELRPRYVLIENVPGLLVYDGMRRVVGELARLGYVGCWRSLRASEFGASHLRKRVFIVAYSAGARPARRLPDSRDGDCGTDRERRGSIEPERHRGTLGDTQRARWTQAGIGCDLDAGSESEAGRRDLADPINRLLPLTGRGPEGRDGAGSGSENLGDTHRWGRVENQCCEPPRTLSGARSGEGLPQFAPGPSDPRWPSILRERPDLAPALSIDEAKAIDEASQSAICGIFDGISTGLDRSGLILGSVMQHRTKRLGRLGNAVVPQIAEWLGHRIQAFNDAND